MKTKSHNLQMKSTTPNYNDEIITVHKSSIIQASMQMAHLINMDINNQNMINHMLTMQHLQQTTGYQQPRVPMMNFTPTMSFGNAALVADRALAIEKARFGDNNPN